VKVNNKMITNRTKKRFLKPCKLCGKPFRPITVSGKCCENCILKRRAEAIITRKKTWEEKKRKTFINKGVVTIT